MGGDTADGGHHLPGRLRHYLHPSGRKVHIARTPDEATALRKTLSQDHQDDSFDLVIQGSPEHVRRLPFPPPPCRSDPRADVPTSSAPSRSSARTRRAAAPRCARSTAPPTTSSRRCTASWTRWRRTWRR